MKKLEIGSGNRPLPGFEHLDINPKCPHLEYVAPMDNIPVDNDTFDEVYAIHVIEHQPWRSTIKTLKEWHRVLKPGGKLKVACPNFKFIAQAYLKALNGDNSMFMEDANRMHPDEIKYLTIDNQIDPVMWANFKVMSSGAEFDQHYAMYTAELMAKLLKEAGFSNSTVEHDGDSLVMWGIK